MAGQGLRERLHVGLAGEAGHPAQGVGIVGNAVGLMVLHHLQPVLDAAQIAIGGDHCIRRMPFDLPGIHQSLDGLHGRAGAQSGLAATPDQLLGLRKELDLADTALAELDVVPGDGDPRSALVGVDLLLDRVHVLDRPEIEMTAPDERVDDGAHRLDRRRRTGDGAGLDHRRPLPGLADRVVVGLRRGQRDHRRCRRRIRPQAQVGAEHVAVRGPAFEQPVKIF